MVWSLRKMRVRFYVLEKHVIRIRPSRYSNKTKRDPLGRLNTFNQIGLRFVCSKAAVIIFIIIECHLLVNKYRVERRISDPFAIGIRYVIMIWCMNLDLAVERRGEKVLTISCKKIFQPTYSPLSRGFTPPNETT